VSGLLDDDRRSGGHWNALGHPGLSLDVGLLRVRSGALLVKEGLVRVIGGSDHWNSLYARRVLLRIAAWTVELGCVGIGRTTRLVWGSSAVAVSRLIHRDGDAGARLVGANVLLVGADVRWDHHRAGVKGDRRAAATVVT